MFAEMITLGAIIAGFIFVIYIALTSGKVLFTILGIISSVVFVTGIIGTTVAFRGKSKSSPAPRCNNRSIVRQRNKTPRYTSLPSRILNESPILLRSDSTSRQSLIFPTPSFKAPVSQSRTNNNIALLVPENIRTRNSLFDFEIPFTASAPRWSIISSQSSLSSRPPSYNTAMATTVPVKQVSWVTTPSNVPNIPSNINNIPSNTHIIPSNVHLNQMTNHADEPFVNVTNSSNTNEGSKFVNMHTTIKANITLNSVDSQASNSVTSTHDQLSNSGNLPTTHVTKKSYNQGSRHTSITMPTPTNNNATNGVNALPIISMLPNKHEHVTSPNNAMLPNKHEPVTSPNNAMLPNKYEHVTSPNKALLPNKHMSEMLTNNMANNAMLPNNEVTNSITSSNVARDVLIRNNQRRIQRRIQRGGRKYNSLIEMRDEDIIQE